MYSIDLTKFQIVNVDQIPVNNEYTAGSARTTLTEFPNDIIISVSSILKY